MTFRNSSIPWAVLALVSLGAPATLAQQTSPSATAAATQVATISPVALPDDPSYTLSSSLVAVADQQAGSGNPSTAGTKGHTDAGEPKQTKRILGVMPNFSSVSANEKLPSLSAGHKFALAGRNTFDYSSFVLAGVQAGVAMNGASYPEFHQGVKGYGRYYWHTLADTADENFMVSGLFPATFHQDPRFYTLGHGGFKRRAVYAATRVFVSRGDDGNAMPNYSEIIGAGAAAGVSSLYYPTHYRTWTKVGQKWLTSGVIDGANFAFKEFWPDINHKLFHTH